MLFCSSLAAQSKILHLSIFIIIPSNWTQVSVQERAFHELVDAGVPSSLPGAIIRISPFAVIASSHSQMHEMARWIVDFAF